MAVQRMLQYVVVLRVCAIRISTCQSPTCQSSTWVQDPRAATRQHAGPPRQWGTLPYYSRPQVLEMGLSVLENVDSTPFVSPN